MMPLCMNRWQVIGHLRASDLYRTEDIFFKKQVAIFIMASIHTNHKSKIGSEVPIPSSEVYIVDAPSAQPAHYPGRPQLTGVI